MELPRVIDRYRLESRLGAGGMGEVFRAVEIAANRPVAIKLIRSEYQSPEAAERFIREVKHTARLVHPNIIKVLDVGRSSTGELYFVMELLEGKSLEQVLLLERRIAVGRAVGIAVQACAALGVAHAAGIVHRDIKPANLILVPRPGQEELVKVLDFGVARSAGHETQLTGTGMLVGTIEFLAPEQLLAQPYDGRADMYALGVTLFQMLTGTALFPQAKDSAAVMYHQVNVRPDPLSQRMPGTEIPPSLEWVVQRCLSKDPAERFANMAELSAALISSMEGDALIDERELEAVPYRRCADCQMDNSRFGTECSRCGSDLETPEQKLFMRRLVTARKVEELAAKAQWQAAQAPVVPVLSGDQPADLTAVAAEPSTGPGPRERVKALLLLLPDSQWKGALALSLLALLFNRLLNGFGIWFVLAMLAVSVVSTVALWVHASD